jgi:predicted O-methyltransferase YrrM
MTKDLWTAVDKYICDQLVHSDSLLEEVLDVSSAAGLPPIAVTPNLGKLLYLFARIQGAKKILEIGTLAGYSTIWLARALPPGGRLISLEADPKHAEIARNNIARAGLAEVVEIRLGSALEMLPRVAAEGLGPFDLIFVDAEKRDNPEYFAWSLKLSRPGSVLVFDNVVRDGAVIDPANTTPSIQGIRRFNELVAAEPRVSATAIQTVGSKGYDGFAIALVTG